MNILKKQGFTLVEIIMSIALFSIISVVILNLFITSANINEKASTKGLATVFASNAIENFDNLKYSNNKITTYYDENWQEINSKSSATYYREVIIASDLDYPNLKHIHVSVYNIDNSEIVSLQSAKFNTEVTYD